MNSESFCNLARLGYLFLHYSLETVDVKLEQFPQQSLSSFACCTVSENCSIRSICFSSCLGWDSKSSMCYSIIAISRSLSSYLADWFTISILGDLVFISLFVRQNLVLSYPTAFLLRNVEVDNNNTFSELICIRWLFVIQSRIEMFSAAAFMGCRIEVVVRLVPQNSAAASFYWWNTCGLLNPLSYVIYYISWSLFFFFSYFLQFSVNQTLKDLCFHIKGPMFYRYHWKVKSEH